MIRFDTILNYLSSIEGYLSSSISLLINNVKNIQAHPTVNVTYGEGKDYVENDGDDIVSENLNQENISKADVHVPSDAAATGIENEKITGDKNDNTILGVAGVEAISTSQASTNFENEFIANSEAIANADVFVEAVGIINQDKITTRRGNDTIIGFATAEATGTAAAFAQSKSTSDNFVTSTANSESTVLIHAVAVGIENEGDIITGKGNDIVIGVASTMSMGNAEASAFTQSITNLSNESDLSEINEMGMTMARSVANANNNTTTLGIINSGKILTGRGDDYIIGLAKNTSEIDVQTTAEAESTANNGARVVAEADSLGIVEGFAVGIVNFNRINTGKGNDTIIGIAVNDSSANAIADADAEANTLDSDTQTNSNAIADTFRAISIGIDNTTGLLITSQGDDQIFGIGTIGITGGEFSLGQGNDRIIGYGSAVGIEDTTTRLGQGDDFFQASIVNIDPLTGGISFQDNQSGSIKNTDVFGGSGNDTFDLAGFEETVFIDGGTDHDTLRLWGSLDDYQISLNSSDSNSLNINHGDSILSVRNIESFYFGDQDELYRIDELA